MRSTDADTGRFAATGLVLVLLLFAAIPAWWVAAWAFGAVPGVRDGVAAGAAAAAVVALGGLAAWAWARNRGARCFLAVLVGGMIVRLALLLAAAAAMLRQTRLDPATTLLAMGAVYCALLTAEAVLLGNSPSRRPRSGGEEKDA